MPGSRAGKLAPVVQKQPVSPLRLTNLAQADFVVATYAGIARLSQQPYLFSELQFHALHGLGDLVRRGVWQPVTGCPHPRRIESNEVALHFQLVQSHEQCEFAKGSILKIYIKGIDDSGNSIWSLNASPAG
jgi:hypothetical protein